MLSNLVLPPWAKYVALGGLVIAAFSYGYVKGQANVYKETINETTKVVYLQGKTTEKVVTKYVKVKEKQKPVDEEIKHEGQAYAIDFADSKHFFNNRYVRLHDSSVEGSVPPLPSGDDGETSRVSEARQLEVAIHNNIVGREWKLLAETCEAWAKKQEELNGN